MAVEAGEEAGAVELVEARELPQSASPVKSHATARNVSGTIEMIPSTVAKPAPTRMPR